MANFTIYNETNAPAGAQDILANAKKAYGLVPSLLGALAENPAALEAYQTLSGIFDKAGFSPLESQVVLIAASVENECHFCVAAHTAISAGQKLDLDVINAVREDREISDPRLEALRHFTKQVVVQRGFVSDADVEAFLSAGFTRASVLAVITGIALKVISNYTNHVAETPVDTPFQAYAWSPADKAKPLAAA